MNAASVNADISALLRARNTLLWIVSREEARVERGLVDACGAAKYPVAFWDCATGITAADGKKLASTEDPKDAVLWLRQRNEKIILVMRDLHKWLGLPDLQRAIRSLTRELQAVDPKVGRAIIVISPSGEVPPEIGEAMVIDYPIPDRAEVGQLLDRVLDSLPDNVPAKIMAPEDRDLAIDAAIGLSAEEVNNCYAKSLVTSRRIDPALVSKAKKAVISRERVLTWHDPDPLGLDSIGGLDVLKRWLLARRVAFTQEARAFGLKPPRGIMLVGIPGTGKSLTAKCVSTAWQMPLLRLDMGALRSKYVGESEGNIRKALRVAEAVAPCVLWLDELDKALAGSTGPAGDGGVSADALGSLLSWMQERVAPVFVVATANDVRGLPPELLRKGRFDELFWVDLPNTNERREIVRASVRKVARDPDTIDVDAVTRLTDGWTGAEIAELVPDVLFAAFADGRRGIRTEDFADAAAHVVPLAKTAAERLTALREWAVGRARPASTPEDNAADPRRQLDL